MDANNLWCTKSKWISRALRLRSDLIPEALLSAPQKPTGMIQVNRKLDRLFGVMGGQQKEMNPVKSEMMTMREEFDSFEATVSSKLSWYQCLKKITEASI